MGGDTAEMMLHPSSEHAAVQHGKPPPLALNSQCSHLKCEGQRNPTDVNRVWRGASPGDGLGFLFETPRHANARHGLSAFLFLFFM